MGNTTEITNTIDAIDALDYVRDTLKALGHIVHALEVCGDTTEDALGLVSDIAYHCAEKVGRASTVLGG